MATSTKKSEDTDPGAAVAAAWVALNPMGKIWLDVMSESVRFLSERLEQDVETQKAMLACKEPAELMKLQAEFYRTAVEQYTAEATNMLEIMQKSMAGSVKAASSGLARRYDDIPL